MYKLKHKTWNTLRNAVYFSVAPFYIYIYYTSIICKIHHLLLSNKILICKFWNRVWTKTEKAIFCRINIRKWSKIYLGMYVLISYDINMSYDINILLWCAYIYGNIYPLRQGWEPLCAFLDKPIPSTPFPTMNVNTKVRMAKCLRR